MQMPFCRPPSICYRRHSKYQETYDFIFQEQPVKTRLQQLKDYEALKSRCRQAEEAKARLEAVVTALDDAVIGCALDGTITDWNPAAGKMFGYPKEDILGRPLTFLITPGRRDEVPGLLSKIARSQRIEHHETIAMRRDGRPVRVCFDLCPVRNVDEIVIGFSSVVRDVTGGRQTEEILHGTDGRHGEAPDRAGDEAAGKAEEQTRARLAAIQTIYAKVPIGLCFVDTGLRYISVNEQFAAMNGLPVEEHIGRKIGGAVPILADWLEKFLLHVIETGESVEGLEIRCGTLAEPDIERDWLAYFSPARDDAGGLIGVNIALQDITEHKRAEEALRFQALHDALTGLPNRMLFMDRLNIEIAEARRNRKMLAVMFLDLDDFKNINDTLGHSTGDKLLNEVAGRLKTCIRESDTMARIGGDEFNLVLPDIAAAEDAASIAKKIISLFADPFSIEEEELPVTASIGISVYPEDGQDADALLKNADIAMYQAKGQGGNNYQFYSSTMNLRTLEKTLIENNFRKMMEHSELVLHYQPQLNIGTRHIRCAEALVRWQHPELGLLNPAQFLPLAAETGTITSIDEWVLRKACAQAAAWRMAGHVPLCVTVNLSARQFQHRNLAKMISQILNETGLDPKLLEVDIAESALMNNVESTVATLRKLADIGICVCLDDFGSAFSCLSLLKRLPVRKLKIDSSFIRELKEDHAYQAIVNAMIEVAHKMNMEVVAEGVETDDQLTFLRSSGCDDMQGYLISRPLPSDKFEQWVMSMSVPGGGRKE
jgi:diguanylate cyclase (GGDEF)-like protein/PAS domain S-box-containing protein